MVIYNDDIFSEDPLHKLHFEEFVDDKIVLHLGYNENNLKTKDNDKIHVLLELEQPNRFLHPKTHETTFRCENYFDKILTINPEFVKNRNKILNKELYEHVFFPYSSKYVKTDFDKTNTIIHTGNKDYFNIFNGLKKYNLIWVGNNGTHRKISYLEKIRLTAESKIAITHSIIDFKEIIPFLDNHSNVISHNNGIFEQHKARTIESAFNKVIMIHMNTGQKVIEEFFEVGKDFLYYEEGLIDEIIHNYDKYTFLSENAYNKAVNNYTTEHFYNKYIKPLI